MKSNDERETAEKECSSFALCLTCKHWKNKQSQLNFSEDVGFCANTNMGYSPDNGVIVGFIDSEKSKVGIGNTAFVPHIFGGTNSTDNFDPDKRYFLCTSSQFGCIYHISQ